MRIPCASPRSASRSKSEPPVSLLGGGFTVGDTYVRWIEIGELSAWKLDLITEDEVRIGIALASGQSIEISEEQSGFAAFLAELELRYAAVVGWEQNVIPPAFARNFTILYRRV